MADHVVVMRQGVIEQQGQPLELYDRPVNRFVAGFIGSPAMNFIPAVAGPDGKSLILDLGAPQTIRLDRALPANRELVVGLRPEHLSIAENGEGAIKVPVGLVESTGSTTYVTTATTPELVVVVNGRVLIGNGQTVGLDFEQEHLHLFDASTNMRIE